MKQIVAKVDNIGLEVKNLKSTQCKLKSEKALLRLASVKNRSKLLDQQRQSTKYNTVQYQGLKRNK